MWNELVVKVDKSVVGLEKPGVVGGGLDSTGREFCKSGNRASKKSRACCDALGPSVRAVAVLTSIGKGKSFPTATNHQGRSVPPIGVAFQA
jgi:hypothetical protein